MSQQTRAAIPVSTKLLEPAPKNAQQISAQLLNKRLTLKRHYDKSCHPLQPLTEGQVVRMQTPKGHNQLGTVKEVSKEPRSHVIQSNGKTCRRNRCHILPVAGPPPPPCRGPRFTELYPPPTMQPKRTSPLRPLPAPRFPAENSNTQYRTRSGRTCRPNPKYMQ